MRLLALLLVAVPASADVSAPAPTANAQYSMSWPAKLPCKHFTSLRVEAAPKMVVSWRGKRYEGWRALAVIDPGHGGDLHVGGGTGRLLMSFSCDAGSASFYWLGPGAAQPGLSFNHVWSFARRSRQPSREEILSAAVELIDAACATVDCSDEARRRRRWFAELLRQPDSAFVRECGEHRELPTESWCSVSPTSDRELSVTLSSVTQEKYGAQLTIKRKLPGDYLAGNTDGNISVGSTWLAR